MGRGEFAIEGRIYNDINEVWDDGDLALIFPLKEWIESANFFLAVTQTGSTYKCPKDEENVDAASGSP